MNLLNLHIYAFCFNVTRPNTFTPRQLQLNVKTCSPAESAQAAPANSLEDSACPRRLHNPHEGYRNDLPTTVQLNHLPCSFGAEHCLGSARSSELRRPSWHRSNAGSVQHHKPNSATTTSSLPLLKRHSPPAVPAAIQQAHGISVPPNPGIPVPLVVVPATSW